MGRIRPVFTDKPSGLGLGGTVEECIYRTLYCTGTMREQQAAVRDAYDELHDAYAATRETPRAELDLLREVGESLETGSRVLDAGCGDGSPVAEFFAEEFEVVGLDISPAQLGRASETVPDAVLVQGELTALGFRANTFDAVGAFYSIIHVPLEAHRTVFEEFARVLEPGGILVFSSGSEVWSGRNPDWLDSGVEMTWSYPDAGTTEDLLGEAGFEVVSDEVVTDPVASEGDKQFFVGRV